MENPFPMELLQPYDLIYRANLIAFALSDTTEEENINGHSSDYRIAEIKDEIPPAWKFNTTSLSYEKYGPDLVEHVCETTISLHNVIQSTFFIDERYSISADVNFIATTFSTSNEPKRMISTPPVKMVDQSNSVELLSFQNLFLDKCTDNNGVRNERGFPSLVNHVAQLLNWQDGEAELRLSVFAVVLKFKFHPLIDFNNNVDLFFEVNSTEESGFESDEDPQF